MAGVAESWAVLDGKYADIISQIDALSQFGGPEDEARSQVELIVLNLSRLQNDLAAQRQNLAENSESASNGDGKLLEFQDRIVIARRRVKYAQLQAEAERLKTWKRARAAMYKSDRKAGSEREDLFAGRSKTGAEESGSYDDQIVSKSASITASLDRLRDMARGEILKSEINIDELDASTRALSELGQKYGAVDLMLNGSRRLVKVLDEADNADRRRMLAALAFLAAVLGWIIYRRILRLPLRILFWSLAKLFAVAGWFIPKGAVDGVDGVDILDAAVSTSLAAATAVAVTASATASAATTAAEPIVDDSFHILPLDDDDILEDPEFYSTVIPEGPLEPEDVAQPPEPQIEHVEL